MPAGKYIVMANETDAPGGVAEEEKQKSDQSLGELALGSERSPHLSEEGHAPPWLRMDPELSRTVLSKTEEELLGSLSALMRNKVEYERAQRALAHTVLEIDQAKQEVAGIKCQVADAEDELNTRLADHERVVDEIAQARSELQGEQSKYLEFQNELIAIRNEIDQARKDKTAASDELAELQLQQGTVRAGIESLKSEAAALHDQRHNILQQVEPLRKELDERLVAREALIQQITTMERHIAELTSTRDIRMNAQRIALVGHGTESMRDEIQQMKSEIERIEKERIRLAKERDMVETEFAGLQNRLSSARSSYAETLEKLDEARATLAVTEKENDEAVFKLQHGHEQEPKPLQAIAETERHQESEEVALNQADRLAEEPGLQEPVQELVPKEHVTEPVVSGVTPGPVPSEPQREFVPEEHVAEPVLGPVMPGPVLNQAAPEAVAKEPEPDPALPLLTNEPLPAVNPTWDSYRLESEFFTEETLEANRVTHLVSELPGIENALVVRQRGAVLAGSLPEHLSDHLKTPGRDYERLFGNWPNRTQERKNASTPILTFRIGNEFLTVTQANDIFLVASHERPKLHPGVEEKLAIVAEELDKMYPLGRKSRPHSLRESVAGEPDSVSAESA
jgi:predicted  nucleic acid-binding Zn-ribbon protein